MNHSSMQLCAGLTAIAAAAFCYLSFSGLEANLCQTAGCRLYEDFGIAGISFWQCGMWAFAAIGLAALGGFAVLARALAGLCLAADCFLLALMWATSACLFCLAAGGLFGTVYWLLIKKVRKVSADFGGGGGSSAGWGVFRGAARSSCGWAATLLFRVWLILLLINCAIALKSLQKPWPILDESGQPRAIMYFSPSCKFCVIGLNQVAGNVNYAFCPIAENDRDIAVIASMQANLARGMSLSEALGNSLAVPEPTLLQTLAPDWLLLRYRLLKNRAHVLEAGSAGVPFFEFFGLPPDMAAKARQDHGHFDGGQGREFSGAEAQVSGSRSLDGQGPVSGGSQAGQSLSGADLGQPALSGVSRGEAAGHFSQGGNLSGAPGQASGAKSADLPLDDFSGQCGAGRPCPPGAAQQEF